MEISRQFLEILIPLLFFAAFRMHHPEVTQKDTDKILLETLHGLKPEDIQRLGELSAPDARLGGEDAERPLALDVGHGPEGRVQDAEGGDGVGRELRVRGARDRAAGGEDRLDAPCGEQIHVLHGDAAQRLRAPPAVGHAPGVGKKDEVFLRKKGAQRLEGREPADPGIEDPDRSVVHGTLPINKLNHNITQSARQFKKKMHRARGHQKPWRKAARICKEEA